MRTLKEGSSKRKLKEMVTDADMERLQAVAEPLTDMFDEIEGNLVIFDNEESMRTAEQIFEEAGLHADEYADDTLSVDELDEDDLDESKSRSEAETLKEETAQKRIASYREFDNGHVLRSMQKMSNEEAEEAAKEASIKNPNDIYYVQYDDIMNPASDLRWYQGRSYDINKYDIRYEEGKPVFTPREM